MKVDFIAFADFASTDANGKMTIVGLFDRINSVAPQIQLPILAIVTRFRAEPTDFTAGPAKVQVRMKAPDNTVLMQLDAEFGVRGLPEGLPREQVTVALPFIAQNIVFARHGIYVCEVWIQNTRVAQTSLVVGPPLTVPQMQAPGARH